ncbi:calcium-binding protein [Microvirga terrae]|uniref:Calcium-binding protein n=1 Tax=Microvirga terrae TaxID=2740529 RepID=A0ABY5RLV0_9HYPH|nr:calcium-binding protein [Microvirga terrae]UVF18215.1 calcium-binding protein [Microvirga terrae]
MATAATILELDMQRVFSNTGGGGIAWGGTGQTGTITGNQTGGAGTGSSYSSGSTGQTQGSGSNDPYAGVTVVYNPVTGRIDTYDHGLLRSVETPDGTPIFVVGEDLVLTLRKELTLEFEDYTIIENGIETHYTADGSLAVTFEEPTIVGGSVTDRPLTVIFEEPTIVGGPNDGRPLSDVLDEQPSSGVPSSKIDWVVRREAIFGSDKGGPLVRFDVYFGTPGSDTFKGSGLLLGHEGNDGLTGATGNDTLDGGTGHDWLDGGTGADLMDGGDGWDVASYQSATSGITVDLTSNANSGAAAGDTILNVEVLQGSNHADRLTGLDRGNGNGVQLYGEGGDDGLTGRAGGDALFGGAGNDWLDGGPGGDLLDGGAGWDVLSYQSATGGVVVDLTTNQNGGAAAGDQVSNIEVLQGSNYADTLTSVDRGGGSGAQLYGEGGNDTLTGKAGGDYLFGGSGGDWLDGGFGCDVLSGGAGADTFRFSTGPGAGNVDTLQDFSAAEGDRIVLSRSVFASAGYQYLSGAAFKLGAAATAAEHRIVYNQTTGELFYDADGSGAAAQVKFAVIANHASLSAASFSIL